MSSPAHKIRIGTLLATIWRNAGGEKGRWIGHPLNADRKGHEKSQQATK